MAPTNDQPITEHLSATTQHADTMHDDTLALAERLAAERAVTEEPTGGSEDGRSASII